MSKNPLYPSDNRHTDYSELPRFVATYMKNAVVISSIRQKNKIIDFFNITKISFNIRFVAQEFDAGSRFGRNKHRTPTTINIMGKPYLLKIESTNTSFGSTCEYMIPTLSPME